MNKVVAIIPVRLESQRFPNKQLQTFCGKPILDHVIDIAKQLDFVERVVIATPDRSLSDYNDRVDEIFYMNENEARCGSERAYRYFDMNSSFDYYMTIPADEPFINPKEINKHWSDLVSALEDEEIGTFYTQFYNEEDVKDTRSCKIVTDEDSVLYFSRSVIPIKKDGSVAALEEYKKHVGIFVFSKHFLQYMGRDLWDDWKSPLAEIESIEQNRFLQFGIPVKVQEIKHIGFGIDTQDQIAALEQRVNENL